MVIVKRMAKKKALKRPKKKRKIAILGTTPSRMLGPVAEDSGWEIWTIGPGGKDVHRWDRLFEVHSVWPEDFKEYLSDLSKVESPQEVWTIPQPDNPARTWDGAISRWKAKHKIAEGVIEGDWSATRRYPREDILEMFPREMWFSSSISWCVALAIAEGASDIGCWGIDLESGEEYISQFVGCAHFLDLARSVGINVHLPTDSGLLRDIRPYPDRAETHLSLVLEKKLKYLGGVLGQMQAEFNGTQKQTHMKEGELLTMRRFGAVQDDVTKAEQEFVKLNADLGQLAANINNLKGEQGATEYYRRMFVWGMVDPHESP